jgi:hypothetical protein
LKRLASGRDTDIVDLGDGPCRSRSCTSTSIRRNVIGATSRIDGPARMRPLLGLFRQRFLDAFRAAAADADFMRILPAVDRLVTHGTLDR